MMILPAFTCITVFIQICRFKLLFFGVSGASFDRVLIIIIITVCLIF